MSDSPVVSPATRRVRVWDLPVRLVHWTLVALFAVVWISGETGSLGLHLSAGVLLLTVILFRILWGLVGSDSARFTRFVRGPGRVLAYLREGRPGGVWTGFGHNPLGGWSVSVLLGLLTLQAGLGLFTTDDIATDGPLVWAASSALVRTASTVHRWGGWVLIGLVALHVSAIAYYRWGKGEDLVTPMIGGDADLPAPAAAEADEARFASGTAALGVLIVAALVVYGGLAIWGR
jgi:cytochrome b